MTDNHEHLRRMALEASNEDEDALLWALAKIGRLTREKAEECEAKMLWNQKFVAEVPKLEAEVERLQAALRRIAGGGEIYASPAHLMMIARPALEGK